MKSGVLTRVLSSRLLEIKLASNLTTVSVELRTATPIPFFEKFQPSGAQSKSTVEIGGFEVHQYLSQFIGRNVALESDAQSTVVYFATADGAVDPNEQASSLNSRLEEFLKSTKFEQAYASQVQSFTTTSSSRFPLSVGSTYELYFEDINADGQFIVFEKSSKSLFVFEALYLSIPVIGQKYRSELVAKLIELKLLNAVQKVQIAKISTSPHSNNLQIVQGKLKDTLELVKIGRAQLLDAAYLTIDDQEELEQLDEAQNTAKETAQGMWAHQTDFQSLANRIDSFLGQIVEVESGDILIIERLSEEGKIEPNYLKVALSKIACPQGLEKGAYEAKEFTRKLAIGQEVDVFLEKDSGTLPSATVVLSANHLNVNQHLVSSGYAKIKDSLRGNLQDRRWIEVEKEEKEAIAAQKGIHSKDLGIIRFKEIGIKETVELYQTRVESTIKKEVYQCIVEKVISGDRLMLKFVKFGLIVKVKLFGIRGLQNNPNQPLIQDTYKRSLSYNYKTLMNRNVTVQVMGIHDHCLVVKLLNPKKEDHSLLLLEQGFAYFKQDTDSYDSNYEKVQKKAKQLEKGVWAQLDTSSLLQLQDNSNSMLKLIKKGSSFGGGQTQVHISQVRDAGEFYVIFEDNPHQKTIDGLVDNYDTTKLIPLRSTAANSLSLVLSVEDKKYYRGKVLRKSGKDRVEVEFIDYGLTEKLPLTNLFQLPKELSSYDAQCQLCTLAYVKVPGQKHRLSKLAKAAFEKLLDKGFVDAEFVGEEHNKSSIILYYENNSDLEQSINALLIKQGFARINNFIANNPFADEKIQELQHQAEDKQTGIWAYDNKDRLSDDSDHSDQDDN